MEAEKAWDEAEQHGYNVGVAEIEDADANHVMKNKEFLLFSFSYLN